MTLPGERSAAREPTEHSPRLSAGRVGRPHGLDGSFYVTRPRARLLDLGVNVTLGESSVPVAILRRAGTAQRPILRLEGIEDRPAAEALRGLELTVEAGEAPVLGEGEWWAHELEGCTVRDGELSIGTVRRLIELPSCEALEVALESGGEPLLVPMVKDAVRRVAPQQRQIEIDARFLGLEPPA